MTQEKYSESMSFTGSHRQKAFQRQRKGAGSFAQGVYSKREEEFKKPAQ